MQSNENSSLVDVSGAQGVDGGLTPENSSDSAKTKNDSEDSERQPSNARNEAQSPQPTTGGSGKRQALVLTSGLLILCAIVFGAYHSVVDAGFLLDDYHHLGYSYNALHGDPSLVIKTFTGNWSGQTDGLTSYRPGISLSFVLDCFLYGLQAAGYHISNLVVFSGCAFLCGVVAFQLSGDSTYKQRLLTAFAAGTLFALYPIHAESVAWIVGRVDVYCTFFYLTSLCLYIHFRKAGSIVSLTLSLLSFFIALICKEMAVTLPAVIASAELLLAQPLGWKKNTIRNRILLVGSFFLVLAGFGILRTSLLGTVVGGYGDTSPRGVFRALKNFLDGATFNKILFGLNEEQPFPNRIVTTAMYAWLVAGLAVLARLAQSVSRLRVFAFLVLWLAISELPTFQIWHIHPNLVGSRLFFLGSTALCVLLSVALVPAFKLASPIAGKVVLKPFCTVVRAVAMVSLLVLGACWFIALQHNLYAWAEAGRQMQGLESKLMQEARSLPSAKAIVLIEIPQDFSGAGLVGRPEYLAAMFSKPIADADYADKLVTLARPIPGPGEYLYPDLLRTISSDPRAAKCLHWSKDARGFVDWVKPSGSVELDLTSSGFNEPGAVENPMTPSCIWLSKSANLDPLAIGCIEAGFKDSSIPITEMARHVRLVWRSQKQPQSWIDYSEGPFAEARGDKLVFLPGRYRSWVLNGTITDLGLQFFPGEYKASLSTLKSLPTPSLIPSLRLSVHASSAPYVSKPAASLSEAILPVVRNGDSVNVYFDAASIAGAKSVTIVVTKTDRACPDLPTGVLPDQSQLLLNRTLNSTSGTFALPPDALVSRGKHQVAILALDKEGKPAGYISEPCTYFAEGTR